MRLKKIKLAGFKSFVDPTTIHFPSSLMGVVGPNGCGKSNIIDAICWVMGESSAKQLRAEAMSDVIFNGSSSRKPVGRAAVEVVFDNSDASLGGEYAKYSELSIRREVSRESTSDYFFNNTSCRRRDIVDIFLGTGLGPSSYAIIEQGTISQFIDAKPDELRRYLEEAAGISRYKERRRETENRIGHTKENLNRLNDIREEVEKQLRHLKYQANAANRYKNLKTEERLTKSQLHILRLQALERELTEQNAVIKHGELQLEQKIGEQHSCEAQLAQGREEQTACLDVFNEVQGRYYQIGAKLARLEQQVRHHQERKEELVKELGQLDTLLAETSQHQATDQTQVQLLNNERDTLLSKYEKLRGLAETSQQELIAAEQNVQNFQKHWDEFTNAAALNVQQVEVEHTRIKHLEQLLQDETARLEKLRLELAGVSFDVVTQEIKTLQDELGRLEQEQRSLETTVENKQQQIITQRQQNDQLASELDEQRNKIQHLSGKYSSLQTLQQVALGKNDADLTNWLEEHNLKRQPRLIEVIKVNDGWEVAAETVLSGYLEALCVDDLSALSSAVKKMEHSNLTILDRDNTSQSDINAKAELLASKIESAWSIRDLLFGIYIAENLTQALQLRPQLEAHETIVTRDGIWLGRSWLHVVATADHKAGVLQRERELHELEQIIKVEQVSCSEKEAELQQQQVILGVIEKEYHELQEQLRTQVTSYSERQSQVHAKQIQVDYLREHETRLSHDMVLSEQELTKMRDNFNTTQIILQEASVLRDQDYKRRELLMQERVGLQECLDNAKKITEHNHAALHDLKTRLEVSQTQLEYLAQNLERNQQRLQSLTAHRQAVIQTLQDADTPITDIEKELETELGQQLAVENELNRAKQQVSEIEHTLHELEKKRTLLYDAAQEVQQHLEQLRVVRQGLETRVVAYKEQIAELGGDLNLVLPEGLIAENLEQSLADLARRIERLGPINLAAIDEFEQQQKRRDYLEAQFNDLMTALNTLEGAISKIDHDTKAKFKETFDNVNSKFQNLFPKIFNGGTASLELVGDDLLNAGATIFAQPPGKRNSSIHLLSGGEKALTAIALIFSIFQLNPAPFCMLDEVDAPLDDLNVGRFCNLVREIAETVQLIFISHNKLTLEMAQHLVGVTMQEPGVSRIVAVAIQEALNMVEKS